MKVAQPWRTEINLSSTCAALGGRDSPLRAPTRRPGLGSFWLVVRPARSILCGRHATTSKAVPASEEPPAGGVLPTGS